MFNYQITIGTSKSFQVFCISLLSKWIAQLPFQLASLVFPTPVQASLQLVLLLLSCISDAFVLRGSRVFWWRFLSRFFMTFCVLSAGFLYCLASGDLSLQAFLWLSQHPLFVMRISKVSNLFCFLSSLQDCSFQFFLLFWGGYLSCLYIISINFSLPCGSCIVWALVSFLYLMKSFVSLFKNKIKCHLI